MFIFELLQQLALYICHVSTRNGFPEPLSPQEEKKLLDTYAKTHCITARNTLVEHNLRLVAHIVKKYSGAAESDDLISIGTIGLIKAVTTYDTTKSTHLATYASRCIENATLSRMGF